jgi:hypothetical protein
LHPHSEDDESGRTDQADDRGHHQAAGTSHQKPKQRSENLAAIQSATTLKFDLTLIGTQISGDGTAFSGFAQSNALSISLFSNPGGSLPTGVNAFIQKSFAAGIATDSSGHGAQWAGADGTRTIAWDLTQFTLTDPTTSTVKTVGKFLTDHPDTNFAAINFVEQFANGTTTTPGAFYFDNVVLAVPEPTSLLLAGLAIPALLVTARRRR